MTAFEVIDVTPDTDEWLEERRKSIGASECAAVMGLSRYATALDVYKGKHGADSDIDPLVAWLGHEDEPTIAKWLVKFSGLNLDLRDGFMARRPDTPYLHASFDRITADGIPVQLKTAHEFTTHKWDEGIPTEYRVQVQAEMWVADAPRALVVVRIGARDFRAIWETRDDRFIHEHMLPAVEAFWDACRAGVPPAPQTVEEAAELWPGRSGDVLELSEAAFEALERRTVLLSDIKAMTEEAEALKLAAAEYVKDATELTYQGRLAYTFRPQKGRTSLDTKQLAADHPELVAAYTRQGAGFRVLRHVKEKNA